MVVKVPAPASVLVARCVLITWAAVFAGASLVKADDVYYAGKYTVVLGQDPVLGRTYRACDPQLKCVFLKDGTAWRDQGFRGITWSNGGYRYSASWQEGSSRPMRLRVYSPSGRLLLNRPMQPKN